MCNIFVYFRFVYWWKKNPTFLITISITLFRYKFFTSCISFSPFFKLIQSLLQNIGNKINFPWISSSSFLFFHPFQWFHFFLQAQKIVIKHDFHFHAITVRRNLFFSSFPCWIGQVGPIFFYNRLRMLQHTRSILHFCYSFVSIVHELDFEVPVTAAAGTGF